MNIPGYQLKKVIATGGMATVYLAVQESLGRKVALKVLNNLDGTDRSERFLSEGRIIAHLNHRNIITIYDIGKFEDHHYIAMEYLEGGTLADLIRRGMRLEQVTDVMGSIASALEYVHGHKIIHRDIKPSNILFHEDGTAKLTDFGIAKLATDNPDPDPNTRIVGSPYYLSPEQVQGKALDHRSDLYGLGVVLYEMLTGERPFAEDTPVKTMVARLNNPVPLLPERLYRFQPLVEKLITKSADDRIGSAKEVIGVVKRLKVRKRRSRHKAPLMARMFRPLHRSTASLARAAIYSTVALGMGVLGFRYLDNPESYAIPKVTSGADSASVSRVNAVSSDPSSADLSKLMDYERNIGSSDRVDALYFEGNEPAVMLSGSDDTLFQQQTSRLVLIPSSSAHDDESEPMEIDEILHRARAAMEDYRLTRPQGDNAYHYYVKLGRVAPGHPEAEKGIIEIADLYALLAQHEINKGNLGDAFVFLGRGLSVMPDHPVLVSIGVELESMGFGNYTAALDGYRTSSDGVTMVSLGDPGVSEVELASLDGQSSNWRGIWRMLSRSAEANVDEPYELTYRAK